MPEDSDDEVDQRVTALESKTARLRDQVETAASDAAAARTLAAGADRDASEARDELRGRRGLLQALRQDHVDLREAMGELRQDVVVLRGDVRGVDQRMPAGFATVGVGMREIGTLLTGLGPGTAPQT